MIGLMTPFRVNNYGTKLQAYAVQQVMRSMGFEAEIVNYDPIREPVTAGNFPRKCFYRLVRNRFADHRDNSRGPAPVEEQRRIRRCAIEAFDAEFLHLSERMRTWDDLTACARRYDAVLSGSDQIFNPVNLGAGSYFLEWAADDARRIALSPSFGVDRLPMSLHWIYRRKLSRFDALSVREESGRMLMERLGFKGAARTLDPTFLVERSLWHEMADGAGATAVPGYVLGYFLGERPLGREALRLLGKNRRIVLLPHIKGYVPEDDALQAEKLYDVGVQEFLHLIRDADCVVTDSFHAAAFSVMFRRPFYAVERHGKRRNSTNARMWDFLSMLGLEKRMIQSCAHVQAQGWIDYEGVEEILSREQEKTWNYIHKSLMDVK